LALHAVGSSSAFVTITVALIGAGGAICAAWIVVRLKQVHQLVNSRLTRLLDVNAALTHQLLSMGVEPVARDEG
jgi:alpha-galactosidase/6-phospho-beta-glucosidase family protein